MVDRRGGAKPGAGAPAARSWMNLRCQCSIPPLLNKTANESSSVKQNSRQLVCQEGDKDVLNLGSGAAVGRPAGLQAGPCC